MIEIAFAVLLACALIMVSADELWQKRTPLKEKAPTFDIASQPLPSAAPVDDTSHSADEPFQLTRADSYFHDLGTVTDFEEGRDKLVVQLLELPQRDIEVRPSFDRTSFDVMIPDGSKQDEGAHPSWHIFRVTGVKSLKASDIDAVQLPKQT